MVCATGSLVMIGAENQVLCFDPQKLTFIRAIEFDQTCTCLIKYTDELVAAFCGDCLYLIDVSTGDYKRCLTVPTNVKTATLASDGEMYFASGTILYKVLTPRCN